LIKKLSPRIYHFNYEQAKNILREVKEGKLSWLEPEIVRNYLKNIEGLVGITIVKKKKKRTLSQNGYYWVLIDVIANELGYDPNELHDSFKAIFLVDKRGAIPIIRSTTSLSPEEMGKYIDKIMGLAREIMPEIVLPEPDTF